MSLQTLELGDLNEPARVLAENARSIDAGANDAPQIPYAGASSELVGTAVTALARAMSELARASANAADLVQVCNDDYVQADLRTADDVADSARPGGPR